MRADPDLAPLFSQPVVSPILKTVSVALILCIGEYASLDGQ